MNFVARRTAFIVIALGLAGCASQDRSYETQPTGLSAADIRGILSGKSWRWSGPNNSGVTLYATDGTSLVEVTGKGTTTGTWSAKDGELCEAFAPAPFLAEGRCPELPAHHRLRQCLPGRTGHLHAGVSF